jgi:hypothetical protein
MDVGLIPQADNKEVVLHKNGSTDDIMEVVIEASKQKPKKGFCQFAKQFDRSYEGLRDLWSFVKYKIPYRVDPDGRQDILLPSALYERGYGDCKSKTVFIVHVLKCLNIPYVVRFTAYTKGANVSHVYPIAYLNGKYVIVDSVYDFFDREKSYKEKIDYNMTKISMISGLREPDVDDLTKKHIKEVQDKQSYVTQQQFVDLSGSVGLSRAFILKRQLELLRAFNVDNPKKVTEFNKAIVNIDKALTKGVVGYKVATVSGSSDIVSAVNHFINTKLQDPKPTFSFLNTSNFASRIGQVDPKVANFGSYIRAGASGQPELYRLGANSKYATNTNFMGEAIAKFIKQYPQRVVLGFRTNSFKLPVTNFQSNTPARLSYTQWLSESRFPSSAYGNYALNNNTLQLTDNLIRDNRTQGLVTRMLNSTSPDLSWFSLNFDEADLKTAFEKYMDQEAGIYQKYIQQDVFNETGKVGAGVLYDYAMGAQGVRSLNEFPTAVVSKKTTQTGWMDGMQYFTGADSTIVRDLGRNTALFALGENPEDSMTKLYNSTKPAVGCEIACISAIIGGIVAIAGIIAQTIAGAKQNATKIEEGTAKNDAINLPTFGPQLMPDETDWENTGGGTTGGGTTGGGSGTGAGTGMNTNLLLGLGLAGAGAYYLYSKNKKR